MNAKQKAFQKKKGKKGKKGGGGKPKSKSGKPTGRSASPQARTHHFPSTDEDHEIRTVAGPTWDAQAQGQASSRHTLACSTRGNMR